MNGKKCFLDQNRQHWAHKPSTWNRKAPVSLSLHLAFIFIVHKPYSSSAYKFYCTTRFKSRYIVNKCILVLGAIINFKCFNNKYESKRIIDTHCMRTEATTFNYENCHAMENVYTTQHSLLISKHIVNNASCQRWSFFFYYYRFYN